ncbi:penicillin-binding transpeptidase domain-containing protein [Streptomyces hydrogenans]|uniref:Penicillin-binding protein n=1 Tax=Streptomyces hydrogenans TaxID=1873719 RepID=A0ABQ3PEH7_9ACTN|nr:penicillin-binding transpeptidase domain-containing protein [Streptomyces hydrogenans]GHG21844.1 penicillin-binding protein [Streptomyces hydrogenans]GHI20550.1 penicillin-binding protein [Streptomyces hydrogenans]GHI23422.1 penicillin-binding protein [Streptomyces hydrogenans]GHI23457.1 penicillin-binding protein [Streptomyces hydrogenans]
MRSGVKVGIVGGVFAVVAGGVAYGGYNLWNGVTGGSPDVGTRAAPKTGPLSSEEVTATARDFLAAWAAGESDRAGQLTNDPVTAGPAVASYREDVGVSEAKITPGTPTGAVVPFTVEATVTYDGVSKPWTYTSKLGVVRGESTGRPLVRWTPTVLHPKLTAGATLRTGTAKAPPVRALDHKGVALPPEKYPSLVPVLDALRQRYGGKAGGTPGVETWIESANGTPVSTLLVLAAGKPGELRTTIDAGVQAAAEKAVKEFPTAAVAAVEPSTGAIRAVANNPASGFNTAFQGKQAPGSTMKIVTGAMMMRYGVARPDSPVECPSSVLWDGTQFENLSGFSTKGDLTNAFAMSCNTAFIKAITPLKDKGVHNTALGDTARKWFGIGELWSVGVQTEDGSVPESSGSETAASYIGQGRITMNALNMASVSATVKNGGFLQPYLVPRDLDGREFAKAERLPGEVALGLQKMMNAAATGPRGTAVEAMAGVPWPKGAKTGSAEVDGQTSNSWFTGYSGDLAAAAVVEAGGHGSDAAGPVVAKVLKAG